MCDGGVRALVRVLLSSRAGITLYILQTRFRPLLHTAQCFRLLPAFVFSAEADNSSESCLRLNDTLPLKGG